MAFKTFGLYPEYFPAALLLCCEPAGFVAQPAVVGCVRCFQRLLVGGDGCGQVVFIRHFTKYLQEELFVFAVVQPLDSYRQGQVHFVGVFYRPQCLLFKRGCAPIPEEGLP